MKPSKLFVNLDDFSNRFKDTFIYHKGVAKYVFSVSAHKVGDQSTYFFYAIDFENIEPGHGLTEENPERVMLDDEEVNFRDYNIGYTHCSPISSMWAARFPARQWKQGFRRDQCQLIGQYLGHDDEVPILAPDKQTFNMLMNRYMSYGEACNLAMVNARKGCRVPFHKNFAIISSQARGTHPPMLGLEYKGTYVSEDREGKLILKPEFKHLLTIPEYSKLLSSVVTNA